MLLVCYILSRGAKESEGRILSPNHTHKRFLSGKVPLVGTCLMNSLMLEHLINLKWQSHAMAPLINLVWPCIYFVSPSPQSAAPEQRNTLVAAALRAVWAVFRLTHTECENRPPSLTVMWQFDAGGYSSTLPSAKHAVSSSQGGFVLKFQQTHIHRDAHRDTH